MPKLSRLGCSTQPPQVSFNALLCCAVLNFLILIAFHELSFSVHMLELTEIVMLIPYAAQDRRALLQEILRRGTSSLGTDIPSEREINRLAARSEDEFWLFEKMDEERRQRENYKSRLMAGIEVPEWVFANKNETLTEKPIGDESQNILINTKRRRKEVVYSDSFGDQWMKSDDGIEDIPKMTPRAKRSSYSSDIQEVEALIMSS